jgi:hypothetical protein
VHVEIKIHSKVGMNNSEVEGKDKGKKAGGPHTPSKVWCPFLLLVEESSVIVETD